MFVSAGQLQRGSRAPKTWSDTSVSTQPDAPLRQVFTTLAHESSSLVWWIDETLSANLVYQVIMRYVALFQVMEQWWRSWWWCGDHVDQVLSLEKKKEKNKKLKAKVKLDRSFLIWWSRHLVSVVTFRIDSHTIKRGETRIEIQLSKCH
jgi:hypothetical protein